MIVWNSDLLCCRLCLYVSMALGACGHLTNGNAYIFDISRGWKTRWAGPAHRMPCHEWLFIKRTSIVLSLGRKMMENQRLVSRTCN